MEATQTNKKDTSKRYFSVDQLLSIIKFSKDAVTEEENFGNRSNMKKTVLDHVYHTSIQFSIYFQIIKQNFMVQ